MRCFCAARRCCLLFPTRNPHPDRLVWDLSTRAEKRSVTSFYWLQANPEVNKGLITAEFDKATNTYTVHPSDEVNGDFSILIHPAMADLSKPVVIKTPDGEHTVNVRADAETIRASVAAAADPNLACVMKISWKELTGK